jgi:4-methylaminobutanoate oxidase (formaldehyde-forming)
MSNEAFPFRSARTIDIGFARALCVRITYLGELGYELYVPAEQAMHVYEQLVAAGEAVDLRHTGLKALASLRMEKGYRDYGHDIDNTDTVFETGLGFAVALQAGDGAGGLVDRDFIGRDAVVAQKATYDVANGGLGTPARRLVQVLVNDPEPLMFHAEVLRRNGIPVGYVRAASYGHTLGGAVGLAMVEPASSPSALLEPITQTWLDAGTWDVEIAGARYPAVTSLRPLYDPKNLRIRS